MDSTGPSILVSQASRDAGARIRSPAMIIRTLAVTGLRRLLSSHDSVDAAVTDLSPQPLRPEEGDVSVTT